MVQRAWLRAYGNFRLPTLWLVLRTRVVQTDHKAVPIWSAGTAIAWGEDQKLTRGLFLEKPGGRSGRPEEGQRASSSRMSKWKLTFTTPKSCLCAERGKQRTRSIRPVYSLEKERAFSFAHRPALFAITALRWFSLNAYRSNKRRKKCQWM